MAQEQPDQSPSELRAVLDVAEGVLAELDLEVVLRRVVEAARELTSARYAAVGVLDASRTHLERFLTAGVEPQAHDQIGLLPRGRGVLGELIRDPRPMRLDDVRAHPLSYGFPSGHPPMTSFLGAPILVDGEPFGNIYLTDKADGQAFGRHDEQAVTVLARLAGIAVDHARRYALLQDQRAELEHTVTALDATVEIARAVGEQSDLDGVLELVASQARLLVAARALVIEREIEGRMVIAAVSGELPEGIIGQTLNPISSVAGTALQQRRTLRLEENDNWARFEHDGAGRLGVTARTGLVVPMLFRGQGLGVLIALDRLEQGPRFGAADQRMLETFAASAATAIATAVSVQAQRAAQRLAAAEQERARWARELHDETLQNLAALQIAIAGQLRARDPESMARFMTEASEQLGTEIQNLRTLIAELRPAALDDLGLEAAIHALAERTMQQGLAVRLSIDLNRDYREGGGRLAKELETGIYRVAQETLTNARKHSAATRAELDLWEGDGQIHLTVQDNGHGFDPASRTAGFGLTGIRERVDLLGGELEISSAPGRGTTVSVSIPLELGSAHSRAATLPVS
ncbi:MAG: GAF domain-containing sensor histidine kinase [Actinomycetota bacterium]|nr:GAF domain-containing sensor histidine kinase [Actinomycetota bacterium]